MFPKQITPFRLTQPIDIKAADLNEELAKCSFKPLKEKQWYSNGFTHPYIFSDKLAFNARDTILTRLKRQEKLLPNSVISCAVKERIAQAEHKGNRKIRRNQRELIKEQVIDELLAKALNKEKNYYSLLGKDYFFVYSGNKKQAENALLMFEIAKGGFTISPIKPNRSIRHLMTEWLFNGECAGNFELGRKCTLNAALIETVKIQGQDLTQESIKEYIQKGLIAQELRLIWDDKIAFTLTDNLSLKAIKWSDVLTDQSQQEAKDAESLAIAEQLIAYDCLSQMFDELIEHLGGLSN